MTSDPTKGAEIQIIFGTVLNKTLFCLTLVRLKTRSDFIVFALLEKKFLSFMSGDYFADGESYIFWFDYFPGMNLIHSTVQGISLKGQ